MESMAWTVRNRPILHPNRPPTGSRPAAGTMERRSSRLHSWCLTAFLIGLVLGLVGLFVVVIRGIALWRHGKRTGGAITVTNSRCSRSEPHGRRSFWPRRSVRAAISRPRSSACASLARASTCSLRRSTRRSGGRAGCASSSRADDARRSRSTSGRTRPGSSSRTSTESSSRRCRGSSRSRGSAKGSTDGAASSPSPSPASGTASPSTGRSSKSLGAERTLCIATSSVRDAENGEAFLGEIEWSYGFTTRLLAGTEEAAMMIRGVTDRPSSPRRRPRRRHRRRLDGVGARSARARSRSRRASTSAACGSPSGS